jgi:hypothetical protein
VDVAGAEVESLRQGLAEQLPGFVLAQQFDLTFGFDVGKRPHVLRGGRRGADAAEVKVAVALKLALAGRYELHPVRPQDLLQEIPGRCVVRVDQSHLRPSVLVFDDHGLASDSDAGGEEFVGLFQRWVIVEVDKRDGEQGLPRLREVADEARAKCQRAARRVANQLEQLLPTQDEYPPGGEGADGGQPFAPSDQGGFPKAGPCLQAAHLLLEAQGLLPHKQLKVALEDNEQFLAGVPFPDDYFFGLQKPLRHRPPETLQICDGQVPEKRDRTQPGERLRRSRQRLGVHLRAPELVCLGAKERNGSP